MEEDEEELGGRDGMEREWKGRAPRRAGWAGSTDRGVVARDSMRDGLVQMSCSKEMSPVAAVSICPAGRMFSTAQRSSQWGTIHLIKELQLKLVHAVG